MEQKGEVSEISQAISSRRAREQFGQAPSDASDDAELSERERRLLSQKERGVLPPYEDWYELASDPASPPEIREGLEMHKHPGMSWEKCLVLALRALAMENERLREQLHQHLHQTNEGQE